MRAWIHRLLPLVLFVVAAELVLAALDAAPPRARRSRGFDPRAAYLVPDEGAPGGHRTQMHARVERELRIPAKGAAEVRVALFGGSNTWRFPQRYLEELLVERTRDTGATARVVNLGRDGYGSGRVAIVFDQARILEPDLAVVYCGHNEFIEWGFERELEVARGGLVGALAPAANRLALYRLLLRAFSPEAPRVTPEDWRYDRERFAGFTAEQTAERLDEYRAHLVALCELARERDLPLVLCTLVTNHYAAPYASTLPPELPEDQRARVRRLEQLARDAFPERFAVLAPHGTAERPFDRAWAQGRSAPREGATPPPLRALEPPLGPERWFGFPATDWSPWIARFVDALSALHAGAARADELEGARRTVELADQALGLVPDHPELLFRSGLALELLGEREAAAERLRAAADAARAPRKVNDRINRIVREVAREHGAHLFDAAALFEGRCPQGLVGWEVMTDHCHLHTGAYRVLMRDLDAFLAPHLEACVARALEERS